MRWFRKLLGKQRTRQVLVHAHLFKNAGTTFDWSLRRSFGDAFVDHRQDEEMQRGAVYLSSWLAANVRCRAISSHWITPPLPHMPGTDLSLCLLLRDPVERMRSVYQFERRQQGVDSPGSIRAKQMNFAEYMAWQMQPMPGPVVKNYQVRYCSGDYLGTDLAAMYQRARALLLGTRSLGLVHRYDESMVLFEHQLRPRFPNLDLSYRRQNVLTAAGGDVASDRQSVLAELADIRDLVLEQNRYDLQLFAVAEQRFEQLLAGVPDLQQRLADLRRRNQRLRDCS